MVARWRTASKSTIPAATDTFSARTGPVVGIETRKSQRSRTSACNPLPSPPNTTPTENFEIHFGVALFGSFVKSHQPVARLFHFLHRAGKIGDARDRQVRERPGGSARHGFRKPGGAAFRNDDALRTCCKRRSHNGAEILRVLDAVKKNQ